MSTLSVIVRSSADRRVTGDLRAAIASLDPNLAILSARLLEDQLNGPVETQLRVAAAVAGAVGFVGLLLAAVGVYGVTAYAVARRTREIGIRLALGAGRGSVVALVLRQSMTLVTIGSAAGLLLGAGAGRLLAASRFGTPALDLPVFAAAAVLFAAVGLVASYLPVRRATRINAMEALRYE
jgi:ABC-type antimicrobial peptide transport system permease subunit